MKKILFLSITGFSFLFASCNSTTTTSESETVEEVASERTLNKLKSTNTEDKSLYLWIQNTEEIEGYYVYTAEAVHENDTVGVKIHLKNQIPAGINSDGSVNQEIGFSKDFIYLESMGQSSDTFVKVLGELWNVKVENPQFSPNKVELLTFSSNKEDLNFDKAFTANFKVFFNPDGAKPGELFLTIDTYYNRITWQEKSQELNQEIVNSLSSK